METMVAPLRAVLKLFVQLLHVAYNNEELERKENNG